MSPCKMIDQNQVFFSRLSDSRINQSSIRRCGHYTYQHWACVFPRRGFEKKHCILCLIVHNTIIHEWCWQIQLFDVEIEIQSFFSGT